MEQHTIDTLSGFLLGFIWAITAGVFASGVYSIYRGAKRKKKSDMTDYIEGLVKLCGAAMIASTVLIITFGVE